METVMRNIFLFLSKNKMLTNMAKEHGLKFGAKRFVAGTTIEEAAEEISALNKEGLTATVDFLGEFVHCEKEAQAATDGSVHAIETLARLGLDSEMSVKLTSLGLDISRELVVKNMRRILDAGKEHGIKVTIDMEDYERCEATLEIYQALRKEYDNVGTVLQAYLYRTLADLQDLNAYDPYLRLVKGAYKESEEVAFPDKADVDENYRHLIKVNLLYGNYTAIATHDDAMIDYVKQLEQDHHLDKDQFEFQMLYGIRSETQKQLAKEGYRVRVYVPYGNDWYGYNMRRLAERPANVLFVLKGLVKK